MAGPNKPNIQIDGTLSDFFTVGKGADLVSLEANAGVLEVRDQAGQYTVARAADPVSGNDLVTLQWANENLRSSGVVLSTISETVTIDRPAIGLYLCIEPTGCLVIEAGACLVII